MPHAGMENKGSFSPSSPMMMMAGGLGGGGGAFKTMGRAAGSRARYQSVFRP